ncbi:MAG: GNAT family N-acetyltransferase [Selenomonadaceae bacterium]
MPKTDFIEMQEEYLDNVLEIYTHYVLNTSATFHSRALDCSAMREIVFFDSEKYKTYVICQGDVICGYVLIGPHKKREAYDKTAEVTIYLKPDYTGQGIGSLALGHMEQYAKQQGLHVLVGTICGENQQSIALVEKNGYCKCAHYKEVGEKFGQRLDVVAYQKIIS